MSAEEKYPLLIGHSLAGRTRLHNIYEVANFICTHGQYSDLRITQKDGAPFLDTFGIYINKITDMEYREELLKALIPMQTEIDGSNQINETDDETEECDMNEYERLHRLAGRHRETYPPGTRLELIDMNDPYAPVPSGTRGTVDFIDDMAQIHMKWDNGRTLALNSDEDSFRKLTQEELAEEQETQDDGMDEDNSPVMGM